MARLEMKKTFFARRGLWIYILALLPLLLFLTLLARLNLLPLIVRPYLGYPGSGISSADSS